MENSFYSEKELKELGFKSLGKNVLLSKKASFYGESEISLGNNIRVDDFCILSGKITIGNHVHIGAGSYLFGGEKGISIDDFSGCSNHVCIYAASDDYSGESLTNPTIPDKFKKLNEGCELQTAKDIIEGQVHSGMSFGLVCSMVKSFCDRGEEFSSYARS